MKAASTPIRCLFEGTRLAILAGCPSILTGVRREQPNAMKYNRRYSALVLDADQPHALCIVQSLARKGIMVNTAAAERARFTDHTRLAIASNAARDLVLDKRETLHVAADLDIPIPQSAWIDNATTLTREAADSTYPVVVKPSNSFPFGNSDAPRSHISVSYTFSPHEVIAIGTDLLRSYPLIAQQYVKGDGVGIKVLARNGEILYAFQHRRLHEMPLSGGGSSLRTQTCRRRAPASSHVSFPPILPGMNRSCAAAPTLASCITRATLCFSNINRSAIAHRPAERVGAKFASRSAGFFQCSGRACDPNMVGVAERCRLNMHGWSSTRLNAQMVADADLILAMEVAQLAQLHSEYPASRGKAFLLALDRPGNGNVEIPDPYGKPLGAYEACFDAVTSAMDELIGKSR